MLTSNEVEAANRAEATALLIRADYRVYRPEADCYGEDLVVGPEHHDRGIRGGLNGQIEHCFLPADGTSRSLMVGRNLALH